MPARGGSLRRLCEDGEIPTWSADGKSIYFIRSRGTFTLWKVPVAGGTPEQIIPGEIFGAREGPDGRDLYFSRVDGIWRRPLTGGKDTLLIPKFPWSLVGYWAVVSDGIYYVLRRSAPSNAWVHHLNFYDFARRQVRDLGPLAGNIEDYVGGLTVSSDRGTVVYSPRTYESTEIMLVEHFR
jgi:hypothetical protein